MCPFVIFCEDWLFQTYNNFVYKKPSSKNTRLWKMSELIAIFDIEDKRLLSLYENKNFDKIIRFTTMKIQLGKNPNYFVWRALAYNLRRKFTSVYNDFIQAKQFGPKNVVIEPLLSKNDLNATFIKYFENFWLVLKTQISINFLYISYLLRHQALLAPLS